MDQKRNTQLMLKFKKLFLRVKLFITVYEAILRLQDGKQ